MSEHRDHALKYRPRPGRRWSRPVLQLLAPVLVALGMAFAPLAPSSWTEVGASAAPRTVRVSLHPLRSGRVQGRAVLTAVGRGTSVNLTVSGLAPGSRAAALIHYGTCSDLAHLSASSASLPNLKAGTRGVARATGRVLSALQRQNVPLTVLADGHHAIVILFPVKGLAACGTIV